MTLLVYLMTYSIIIEGYYRIDPWVDTRTKEEYSEEKFKQIEVGMDTLMVKRTIGTPYSRLSLDYLKDESKSLCWYFTGDGKFERGDFAWMGRGVYFNSRGEVTEILRTIHYD